MVKTKRRKTYTDKEKVAAVEMYLSGPNSMRDVADALGMNVNTLNQWTQRYRVSHPEDER